MTQSADSSANLSAAVSTGLSAVSSANLSAVLKQGDCPPADAGSSVNAAQEQNSLTRPDQTAANSLAAAAATAQLDNDLLSGSQERCPPADAGSSATLQENKTPLLLLKTLRISLLLNNTQIRSLLPQPPLDSMRVSPLAHNRGTALPLTQEDQPRIRSLLLNTFKITLLSP